MVNGKQKGKKGELEFKDFLIEHGITARRSQQYSGTESTADIISDLEQIHFEVKRVELLNIEKAMAQAITDKGADKIPVVSHRRSHKEWMITMLAKDWMPIIKHYYGIKDT